MKGQVKAPAWSQGGHLEVAGHCLTRELAEQKATRVAEAILDMEYTFMDENVLNLSVKRNKLTKFYVTHTIRRFTGQSEDFF